MSSSKTNKKNTTGFTLIELLVVISVIGFLASVVLVSINSARVKARNAKRIADIKQIAQGLALFYDKCGTYPALPPATFSINLDNTKSLYSGTTVRCNADDQVFGSNGVLPNGGIGAVHTAGAGETLFLPVFPRVPTPVDDGSLTTGNKCSETNSQTGVKWGQYSYTSFAPGDPDHFWLYFCISDTTGDYQAGRYVLNSDGIIKYAGNLFP